MPCTCLIRYILVLDNKTGEKTTNPLNVMKTGSIILFSYGGAERDSERIDG